MTALTWHEDLHLAGPPPTLVRTADPADARAVAALMAEPAVDEWWHQTWSTDRWAETLHILGRSEDTLPLVVCDEDSVVGYVEVYRVSTDVLGAHTPAEHTDLGLHLALSGRARGRGLGRAVIAAVLSAAPRILPGCGRLMAEPDVANIRSQRVFARAGFEAAGVLDLPDKQARLMVARAPDVYDVVAVGAGPFNIGLAALASTVDDLSLICFDSAPELTWHRGLMLDGAQLQVSFLADLVTLVDPTHPLSFLAYLRDQDRMYPFYVREQFHPTRREYEDYLRWAARRLETLRFGHRVESVDWDEETELFEVTVRVGDRIRRCHARHVVVGVGTEPRVPASLDGVPAEQLVHSGSYLDRLDEVTAATRVTVVGSGQSGAECFLDLLRRDIPGQRLSWLTRTESFAPLDYTKLVLEMTTPAYVDHFHALPQEQRDHLVTAQWRHYKGISTETIDEIHDALYARSFTEKAEPVRLCQAAGVVGSAVTGPEASDEVVLDVEHQDTGYQVRHHTDLVVAATGYGTRPMPFADGLSQRLGRDGTGRLRIRRDHAVEADGALAGRVFVANADLHTHGPAAPDLGFGAVRNATILNTVTGRECYRLPGATSFTTFGTSPSLSGDLS